MYNTVHVCFILFLHSFFSSNKSTLSNTCHKVAKPVITLGPQTVAIDIPPTKSSAVPLLAALPDSVEKIPLVGSSPVKAPPTPNPRCNLTGESPPHHRELAPPTKRGKVRNNSLPSAHSDSAPANDAWLPPGGIDRPDDPTTDALGLSSPSRERVGEEEEEDGKLTDR